MLIGQTHRKRIPVCLRMGDHTPDTHLTAGTDDPQSNLPAVRYQNLTKHFPQCVGATLEVARSCPASPCSSRKDSPCGCPGIISRCSLMLLEPIVEDGVLPW